MEEMGLKEKNLYLKIQAVKEKLLKANIKKSGHNKFAGYTYYELSDFIPYIIKFCNEEKIFTSITFTNEYATLTIINSENPSEKIRYTSPMRELSLKGCNEIQGLGGVETYSRRYLYMSAFDIIENDMFDAVVNSEVDKKKQMITNIKKYKNALEVVKKHGKKLSDCTEEELTTILNELKELDEDKKKEKENE